MYFKFILAIFCLIAASNQVFASVVPKHETTKNWFTYEGKTYFIQTIFQTNMYKAMLFCKQMGMELLTINNEFESKALANYLMERGFNNWYWTSATNMVHPYKWEWMTTGKELKYFNWRKGNPDNWNKSERCMEVGFYVNEGFTWNDLECDRTDKHFICETNLSS